MIKYFYHHQFQLDVNNGMIIPDVKKAILYKSDILEILERDKVDVAKILSIKYYNFAYSGWIEINDTIPVHFQKDHKEIRLLLSMKEDFQQPESELQVKYKNLVTHFEALDKKIVELEKRIIIRSVSQAQLECPLLLDLYRNPSCVHTQSMQFADDPRLDITFLYANPLVTEINGRLYALKDPIDFESEINCLVNIFEYCNKKITARFEVANIESISEVFLKKPKILHISCHGDYEEINGENKFFLHIEQSNGILAKLSVEDLNKLLKPSVEEQSQIEVVFVSACYSEPIANVFKEAKIPVVICVHSMTQILDEAAQRFAKIFYQTLLDGKPIGYAFDHAKQICSSIDKNSKLVHCCCSHIHKPQCLWQERAMDDEKKAHQFHLKRCKCEYDESHVHSRACPWALKLLREGSCRSIQFDKFIKICCCSPEIAHDESNKFVPKIDPGYEKEILFHNLPKGALEIKNKNCCLNVNFSVEMKTSLIGRNIELHNVVNIFANSNITNNRLITIYGEEGLGKNSFVKLAGKYMYERKLFQDGVIYVNTYGQVISEMWLVSQIISHLDLEYPIDGLPQFCKIISQARVLIIIRFGKQTDGSLTDLRHTMTKIIESTKMPKFLLAISKPLELDVENKIELTKLTEKDSARLLTILAGDNLQKDFRDDLDLLAEHEIIKISKGIPNKIHQIAGLLQEHKRIEVLIEKIKKENTKKQTLSDELVKFLLENMTINSTVIYEVLYILSVLPHGILDCEVCSLGCFTKFYKEVLENLDKIASSTIIITKSKIKDFSQWAYILDINLISSIQSLVIDENLKIKCLKDLVIFYGKLMRDIVNNLYINTENPTEFSAALNDGIWLSFNSEFVNVYQKCNQICQPTKRYNFDEYNILTLLRCENPILRYLMDSQDPEFIESIEQLSICMPTILKINKNMPECMNCYDHFLKLCEEFKLVKALGRLYLFKASFHLTFYIHSCNYGNACSVTNSNIGISFDCTGTNCNTISSTVFQARELLKDYDEGEAEAYFVKAVVSYEIEIMKNKYLPEKVSKEKLYEILKDLDTSITIYRKKQNFCGLARVCFVMGEYCLNNKKYESTVLSLLCEARDNAEKCKKGILQIRCNQSIAKWYMENQNYPNAKLFAEHAKLLSVQLKINNEMLLYEINKQINEILDQSKAQSHNVFVFIKAHQLVRTETGVLFERSKSIEPGKMTTCNICEYPVGPIVNHISLFKDRLNEQFRNSKKELIIKFDYLTDDILQEVISKVGRVLHISSDDFNDKGSLFVENLEGESHELASTELKKLFKDNQPAYDIVFLAIPQSEKLAQVFVDAGIPHVVCFQFLDEFLKVGENLPTMAFFNIIHEFTISMLGEIINEKTILESYNHAVKIFNIQIGNICEHMLNFNLGRNIFRPGTKIAKVLLLPQNSNQNVKLFGRAGSGSLSEETFLFEGKILDLSKMRARLYNIKKRDHAIIGRKREIYKGVTYVKTFPLVNIYGDAGSGRTCLVKEICYFLYMRNYFRDGIFYFDLKDIKKLDQIKTFFREADVYASIDENKKNLSCDTSNNVINSSTQNLYNEKKMLIVFDNVDKLIKYADNQLFMFLLSLKENEPDNPFMHFILISTKQILNFNNLESLEVPPLTPTESLYFFLYYVNRTISSKEVDVDQSLVNDSFMKNKPKNMCDLLIYSCRISACQGMPKYLKRLADLASSNSLKSINWKELCLPRKKANKKKNENSSQNSNLGTSQLSMMNIKTDLNNTLSRQNSIQNTQKLENVIPSEFVLQPGSPNSPNFQIIATHTPEFRAKMPNILSSKYNSNLSRENSFNISFVNNVNQSSNTTTLIPEQNPFPSSNLNSLINDENSYSEQINQTYQVIQNGKILPVCSITPRSANYSNINYYSPKGNQEGAFNEDIIEPQDTLRNSNGYDMRSSIFSNTAVFAKNRVKITKRNENSEMDEGDYYSEVRPQVEKDMDTPFWEEDLENLGRNLPSPKIFLSNKKNVFAYDTDDKEKEKEKDKSKNEHTVWMSNENINPQTQKTKPYPNKNNNPIMINNILVINTNSNDESTKCTCCPFNKNSPVPSAHSVKHSINTNDYRDRDTRFLWTLPPSKIKLIIILETNRKDSEKDFEDEYFRGEDDGNESRTATDREIAPFAPHRNSNAMKSKSNSEASLELIVLSGMQESKSEQDRNKKEGKMDAK